MIQISPLDLALLVPFAAAIAFLVWVFWNLTEQLGHRSRDFHGHSRWR